MTKIGLVGSRTFDDVTLAKEVITKLFNKIGPFICVSGGAIGADIICEKLVKDICKTVPHIFNPNWRKYGKTAGIIRNCDIVKNSDALIAFWDSKSKGTLHTIVLAQTYNKPILVIEYTNTQKTQQALSEFNDLVL